MLLKTLAAVCLLLCGVSMFVRGIATGSTGVKTETNDPKDTMIVCCSVGVAFILAAFCFWP